MQSEVDLWRLTVSATQAVDIYPFFHSSPLEHTQPLLYDTIDTRTVSSGDEHHLQHDVPTSKAQEASPMTATTTVLPCPTPCPTPQHQHHSTNTTSFSPSSPLLSLNVPLSCCCRWSKTRRNYLVDRIPWRWWEISGRWCRRWRLWWRGNR